MIISKKGLTKKNCLLNCDLKIISLYIYKTNDHLLSVFELGCALTI